MAYNVIFYRRALSCASSKAQCAKFILTALIFVLSINILAMAPAISHAQEIYYDGSDSSGLQVTPEWVWGYEGVWPDSLFPDSSPAENASGNKVTINYNPETGDKKLNSVYGGLSGSGNATDNTVIVINGQITGQLRGGFAYTGDVLRNTLIIHEGTFNDVVHGGCSLLGTVGYNTVTIHGGTFTENISGGHTNGGSNVIHNTVNLLDGTVNGSVFGGSVAGYEDAVNNTVNINGGVIIKDKDNHGDVYGGWSIDGNARGNSANVTKGTIDGSVIGGYSSKFGDATDNIVTISDGKIGGSIYGGYAENSSANYGRVVGNSVNITSGDIGGSIFGGRTEGGSASDNQALVFGGKITGDVNGGYSYKGGVTANTVRISGGAVAGHVRGGWAALGDATDNLVNVSGGEITGSIYGGLALKDNATGNTVTISGGEITGNIYGGHAVNGYATNNTVNINGAPVLSDAYIYGGYGGSAARAGNTLNFKNSGTIEAAGAGNFEYYNFWLPAGTANLDKMLLVTAPADVDGSRVEVLLNGESVLSAGDKIALISSESAMTGTTSNDKSQSMLGATVLYEFDIYAEDNVLWAKLPNPGHAAPESGALTGSHLVSAALLAQAADMAAVLEYIEVSRDRTDSRYVTFAAVNGGSSVYDIGADSEIDIDSFLLIAGVMWDVPVRKNSLLLRAFAEAGWGGYDTRGSYGGSLVRGRGDSSYYGAGLHARYQWTEDHKPGGLYADASLRAGRAEADFATADMKNSMGTHARYDTSSSYHSAHVGIGHIWRLSGKTSLDLSSKYLWTRLRGDTFTMATGDRVELGSTDSGRWRTGFRAVHDRTEDVSFFFGAYYEYEFDGEANGRVYGTYDIEKASMSGGTGIGELGLIFRPVSNDRFSALLGVQGYVGAREGFSGRLKLQYNM